jgi:hypothetical protein
MGVPVQMPVIVRVDNFQHIDMHYHSVPKFVKKDFTKIFLFPQKIMMQQMDL